LKQGWPLATPACVLLYLLLFYQFAVGLGGEPAKCLSAPNSDMCFASLAFEIGFFITLNFTIEFIYVINKLRMAFQTLPACLSGDHAVMV
jgi:hypothetical protein